jgi:hypothetical protein
MVSTAKLQENLISRKRVGWNKSSLKWATKMEVQLAQKPSYHTMMLIANNEPWRGYALAKDITKPKEIGGDW